MDESTPTAPRILADDSTMDVSLGDTTSNLSTLQKGDDSLLGHVLLGGESVPESLRSLTASIPRGSEEEETTEQVNLQLQQLRQLNQVFEVYEDTLTSSMDEIQVRTAEGCPLA